MNGQLKKLALAFACLLPFGPVLAVTDAEEGPGDEWRFRVYLDDSEIGYHNFSLIDEGDTRRMMTEAEFRVKFLFITAYEYEHVNREVWQDDCLKEINARTNANGKEFEVYGVREDDRFALDATDGRNEVPGCVKSFAYWNPDILDEPVLLNSQTGELLPVTVEPVAVEKLNVRGMETEARRYRLLARGMELDIWYSSEDQRWLRLESTVKGGRKLRYVLT